MSDNVIKFGRTVQADPELSEEEHVRVTNARREFQEFLFEEIYKDNPPNDKGVLYPVHHLYSMLLSDSLILQVLDDPELSEFESDAQRISYYQLSVMTDFMDISNEVYGTGFVDTNYDSGEA